MFIRGNSSRVPAAAVMFTTVIRTDSIISAPASSKRHIMQAVGDRTADHSLWRLITALKLLYSKKASLYRDAFFVYNNKIRVIIK